MTLARARILKGEPPSNTPAGATLVGAAHEVPLPMGRRVAADVALAHEEAARILANARARAAEIAAAASETAAGEARQAETAKLAAAFLALRDEEARRAERDLDRIVHLAKLLAERLLGETLRLEPARIAEIAAVAIEEARGARRVRVDASPEDIPHLRQALGAVCETLDVQQDPSLGRGSLVVHTDIGRIDARLEPQLARLAAALREALS
jgi:flagellar assembly protein FliH/type III secretion protein L